MKKTDSIIYVVLVFLMINACGSKKSIVGVWQFKDNAKYTFEFFDDGTFVGFLVGLGDGMGGKYTILNDGRIKVTYAYAGITGFATMENNVLVIKIPHERDINLIKANSQGIAEKKDATATSLKNSAEIIQDAQKARNEKDFDRAANLYALAAEKGDTIAQINLASMYTSGQEVPRDYSKAAKLYQKAAESKPSLHQAIAQTNLAAMYVTGRGVQCDYSKAIELYEKASKQNYHAALYALAMLYATCKDPKYRDGKKALDCALKAYSKDPQNFAASQSLAAAYAANGNFEKAVEEQEKFVKKMKNISNSNTKKGMDLAEKLLALYKNRQTYIIDENDFN